MDKKNKPREIAVDFDATLGEYDESIRPYDPDHLGAPIPEMLEKVKKAIESGANVRIFTARVYPGADYERALNATKSFVAIAKWCEKYLGEIIPIECMKSYEIDEIWDDRARQVVKNTGMFLDELSEEEEEPAHES